jgi:hypothetical protein
MRNIDASDYIATVALVVSMVAIVSQLVAGRRQLFIQNFGEYGRRYSEILTRLPRDFVDPSFNLAGMDEPSQEIFLRGAWAYFDLCFEQWYLGRNRFIGRKLWGMWEAGMVAAMQRPSFSQSWTTIKSLTSYPSEFVAFIDLKTP